MIKAIIVTNDNGESLRLELANPEQSEIAVENIEGLGPEKANINSTDNQVYDGSTYDSSNVPQKPITINLKFLPNDGDIERIRHKCYDYFPTTKNINLKIETDERCLDIDGYVESNLPEIFSETEGSAITILCMNPYFKGIINSEEVLKGIEKNFSFPFSNESLTEKLIIMGIIYNDTTRNIYYYGEKEAGVNIRIDFSDDLPDIQGVNKLSIKNLSHDQKMVIDIKSFKTKENITITDGDYILIDTTFSNKSIYYYKNGVEYNLLPYIDLQNLSWIMLEPKYNTLQFDSTNNTHISGILVNNKVLYRGV